MLSLIVFLPLIGAAIVASISRENRAAAGWVALFFAFETFVFSLSMLQSVGGGGAGYALETNLAWLPALGARYHLAADSLAFLMVALTGLLSTIAIAASVEAIKERQHVFFSLLLLLQAGINGTFLAVDLVLFYIFWELMLIPLYFLIGLFGSRNRFHASMKFFLFTFFGSAPMLIAILYLTSQAGTSDFPAILEMISKGTLELSETEAALIFGALFLAFAVKAPLFPLHTWLPDAHTEAPTAGSVMLAGVLLKTGIYGMIRFCMPILSLAPEFKPHVQWVVSALAAFAIIYGALAAIAQTDMKRLVAYSSVSHMGFIVLGLFAFNETAVTGAILQMINHGISTSGLFLCVGFLYERRHTREMSEFGGLASNLKIYAALTMVMVLSSAGLPLLNGFVGEFWILAGAFQFNGYFAVMGALGVILGAIYLLTMFQKVFHGPLDAEKNGRLKDLCGREIYALLPLVLLAFWIGVYSKPFTDLIRPTSQATIDYYDDVWREKKKTAKPETPLAPEPLPARQRARFAMAEEPLADPELVLENG